MPSSLVVLVLIKGMSRGSESEISFCYCRGVRAIPSDLLQVRWPNLVRVEYLQMVKSVVVGFCSVWD